MNVAVAFVDEPAQRSISADSASASLRSRTISRSTFVHTRTRDRLSVQRAPRLFVAKTTCVITSMYEIQVTGWVHLSHYKSCAHKWLVSGTIKAKPLLPTFPSSHFPSTPSLWSPTPLLNSAMVLGSAALQAPQLGVGGACRPLNGFWCFLCTLKSQCLIV